MNSTELRKLFAGNPHSPSLASLAAHLGVGEPELIDFCVPCNPYFPTEEIFSRLQGKIRSLIRYYPSDVEVVGRKLAPVVGIDPAWLVACNGSDELIAWIDERFGGKGVCTSIPTFNRWVERPRQAGRPVHLHRLHAEEGFRFDASTFASLACNSGSSLAVIVNPNNPTGGYIAEGEMMALLQSLRRLDAVVVDESFIDFALEERIPSAAALVERFPNLIVLKSLGKNLGLHGMRLGYAVCRPERAKMLRQAIPRWTVNALGEALIGELSQHADAYEQARRQVVRDRIRFQAGLESVPGLKVYPSWTNFVTFQVPEGVEGVQLRDALLLEKHMFVRECGNKDGITSQFIRVACRKPEDNDALCSALHDLLVHRPRHTIPAATGAAELGVEIEVNLPVNTDCWTIDMLRQAVDNTVQAAVAAEKVESALSMVVAELLEGTSTASGEPSFPSGVQLNLVAHGARVCVEVEARVDDVGKATKLKETVDWLNTHNGPKEAYLDALQHCWAGESAQLEMNLVRVAYEGNAGVECEVTKDGLVRLRVELPTTYQ